MIIHGRDLTIKNILTLSMAVTQFVLRQFEILQMQLKELVL